MAGKKELTFAVCFGIVCLSACAPGQGGSSTSETPEGTAYVRTESYQSFWQSDMVKNETVMLEEDEEGIVSGRLLFEPTEIIAIKNYDLTVDFAASDYALEGCKIVRTQSSSMPYMSYSLLQGEGIEEAGMSSMDGLVFTEGKEIVSRLINVTYRYDPIADPWMVIPEDKSPALYNLKNKLEAGEEIELFLYGDSIAAGCNASSVLGYNPYLPTWGQAVAD